MDTRQAVLVDVCAAEPTGGAPAGFVPDGADLTDDQLQAVATELAVPTAVSTASELRFATPQGVRESSVLATIGTAAFEHERGSRAVGTDTVQTPAGTEEIEVTTDGGIWLTQQRPTVSEATVTEAKIGEALGVDIAAIRDVGADLPPTVLSTTVDVLAVPVNFLEHLSGADPDPATLQSVVTTADVDAVCAFTFDTLAAEAACHARVFAPAETPLDVRTSGLEAPAMPTVAGGLVSHLFERGTIEDATTSVEQGQFMNRPGRIHVEAGERLRVGGHAVTTLDGTVTVPPADDDDIIEA